MWQTSNLQMLLRKVIYPFRSSTKFVNSYQIISFLLNDHLYIDL